MVPTSSNAQEPSCLDSAGLRDHSKLVERIRDLSCKAFDCEVELIGRHPTFVEAVQKLERFASSDEPVLITGESGVGKELFAKALYVLSNRNGQPFVPVNCGRFGDENLTLSELFGHVRGSFTGATGDRLGAFQTANHGMIFLDEVGELSLRAQAMLLRVLEQKEITPLGSDQSRHVDIRVISATHRDLGARVESSEFREDLLYRLSCLPLHVPALRERGDNRFLLLEHFLAKLNDEHKIEKQFSEEALSYLREHSFPGNVRELKNVVDAGFWGSTGKIIGLQDITTGLQQRRKSDQLTFEVAEYYGCMVEKGECFWEVIREPFIDRDLNRKQVRVIIEKGMRQAGGFKELCRMFNVPLSDYKRFLNFLNTHDLRPTEWPIRSVQRKARNSGLQ